MIIHALFRKGEGVFFVFIFRERRDEERMKVLVVGRGGRELAVAWKHSQSAKVEKILCAPGNAGTLAESKCSNHPVSAEAPAELLELAKKERVDLTVVGPDNPLAMGIVDLFQKKGMRIFGPT